MTALRSERYLAGSRGAPCSLRIPGVCRDERETTVPAHIRDKHKGGGNKASDLSVADACEACHMVFDRQRRLPNGLLLSNEEWTFYALRGLQDTLERRRELKLLTVVGAEDERPSKAKPVPVRKPKAERRSIPSGKKLESANRLPRKGQAKLARRGMQMKGEY